MQGITVNRKAVFWYIVCPLLLAVLDAFYCQGSFTFFILIMVIPVGIVLVAIYLFLEWIDATRSGDVRKKTTRQIVLLLPFVVFGLIFQSVISSYVKEEFTEMTAILLEHKRAFGIPEKLSEVPQIAQRWEVRDGNKINILGRRIDYMYSPKHDVAKLVRMHMHSFDRTIFDLQKEETYIFYD